jgi:hypothetical protein
MALSSEVAEIIQEAVKIGGKALEGKLPPKPYLKKRNPYAHLYERVKARMGKSYKDCEDWQASEILRLIEYYSNNPC